MTIKWQSWDLNPASGTVCTLAIVNPHKRMCLCLHPNVHVLVGDYQKGFCWVKGHAI